MEDHRTIPPNLTLSLLAGRCFFRTKPQRGKSYTHVLARDSPNHGSLTTCSTFDSYRGPISLVLVLPTRTGALRTGPTEIAHPVNPPSHNRDAPSGPFHYVQL